MTLEEFKCDILDILENEDYRSSFLEKLETFYRNFRSNVIAQIEKRLLYEKDCTNNAIKISELQQKIDTITSNVNAIMLQEKVIDKKISDVIKLQDNIKTELEEGKKQKDALFSEIMDLELEIEERKRKKVLQWDAIKRACNIYKVNLDMHISLEEKKDCDYIKVNFFTHNNETKDKYYVQLLHSDDCWIVEHTEPKLKKEHFNELSIDQDSSGHTKVMDITLFLYEIRSIFLKYYT
ncbi:uncharacterized protein LOC126849326 [Cataglyphis hispanica]|uniref:uncharacterized protein LOC126849326 n=1 Tax=Cataglyphis hispanica TaxID=1086592 RepID=UPI0021805894|nr:uncharacterized protein LOC126849326 [Cataglyphis hispanica]